MPPINQQGSRAGLITATVIFATLFVVSAILAIYFSVQLQHTTEPLKNNQTLYTDIISDAALAGPEVSSLKAMKGDPSSGMSGSTVFDAVIKQRNDMIELITGAVPSS